MTTFSFQWMPTKSNNTEGSGPISGQFICKRYVFRVDSRSAPRQWETPLLCNDVSHWLGASLESAPCIDSYLKVPVLYIRDLKLDTTVPADVLAPNGAKPSAGTCWLIREIVIYQVSLFINDFEHLWWRHSKRPTRSRDISQHFDWLFWFDSSRPRTNNGGNLQTGPHPKWFNTLMPSRNGRRFPTTCSNDFLIETS